jgi:heme-degrading monooxygenase HmoA
MLFDRTRPHAFREYRVAPSDAHQTATEQVNRARVRAARSQDCQAWAVHVAKDATRVIVVEAWRDIRAFQDDADAHETGCALYKWAATGGREPTPVQDTTAGVIVIDIFPVWRPLLRPVSAFNIKNGESFNKHPGCISTTVLRGVTAGSIATYARWRSEADFFDAFEMATKAKVSSTQDINDFAIKKTFGLLKPDYHIYDLVEFQGDAV